MGRLIDTDVLEAFIKTHSCVVGTDGVLLTDGEDNRWHNLLEYIPTAYDVDQVSNELKADSCVKLYGSNNSGNYMIPVSRAIEIVKQGGVSDVCEWRKDGLFLYTSCGDRVNAYSDDFKYCPYCSKKIKVVE